MPSPAIDGAREEDVEPGMYPSYAALLLRWTVWTCFAVGVPSVVAGIVLGLWRLAVVLFTHHFPQ